MLTLITAILVSYTVWSLIEVWDGDYGTYQRGIGEIIADFITSAIETVIIMECSFLICKMVLRVFRNAQYSTFIVLIQNVILLASVIVTAGRCRTSRISFIGTNWNCRGTPFCATVWWLFS